MKKVLSILLAALLIAAILPMTALAEASVYISSTGSGTMNVRSGPGKDYSVKGYVHHKDTVTQLETSGEWSKVKVHDNGITGWIKTKYIDGTTANLGSGYKTVKVSSGEKLNLRKGPGTNYGINGTVSSGAKVKVMYTEDEWVKVYVSATGKTGWIMAKYIGAGGSSSGSSSSGSSASSSGTQSVYRVTGSSLNVRKGAGTSYGKVATLYQGDAFKVTGSSGNWFRITAFNGISGWVSKNYTTAGANAIVTASSLNMRSGAGTGYGVVKSLAYGTEVKVNSITGNWAHITVGGRSGHVSAKYLQF